MEGDLKKKNPAEAKYTPMQFYGVLKVGLFIYLVKEGACAFSIWHVGTIWQGSYVCKSIGKILILFFTLKNGELYK